MITLMNLSSIGADGLPCFYYHSFVDCTNAAMAVPLPHQAERSLSCICPYHTHTHTQKVPQSLTALEAAVTPFALSTGLGGGSIATWLPCRPWRQWPSLLCQEKNSDEWQHGSLSGRPHHGRTGAAAVVTVGRATCGSPAPGDRDW
eukprot:1156393-Pelagomonas_calceolata.AAC.2